MSKQSDTHEMQQLERINAELEASLDSCRAILRDCQARLAANSNEVDETATIPGRNAETRPERAANTRFHPPLIPCKATALHR